MIKLRNLLSESKTVVTKPFKDLSLEDAINGKIYIKTHGDSIRTIETRLSSAQTQLDAVKKELSSRYPNILNSPITINPNNSWLNQFRIDHHEYEAAIASFKQTKSDALSSYKSID